jgi:hypothetical protein
MFSASFKALSARLTVINTDHSGHLHAMMPDFGPGKPSQPFINKGIYAANLQNTLGTGLNTFAASLAMP